MAVYHAAEEDRSEHAHQICNDGGAHGVAGVFNFHRAVVHS